jgi:shikimate kinase
MSEAALKNTSASKAVAVAAKLGQRSIVLVGMMGAGKSSIGRRLATELGLRFVDADTEIEAAAGMTIPEIFDTHGEPYFRSGEARVIARLLDGGPQVLASGGGAFINPQTRALIRERGVSVWLKADDPEQALRRLVAERSPVYAEADLTVHSQDVAHEAIVADILAALAHHLQNT